MKTLYKVLISIGITVLTIILIVGLAEFFKNRLDFALNVLYGIAVIAIFIAAYDFVDKIDKINRNIK